MCACGGAKTAETTPKTESTINEPVANEEPDTGSELQAQDSNAVSEDELFGNWREIHTFNNLYLEKGSGTYSSQYEAGVLWSVNNGTLSLNSGSLKGDFNIISSGDKLYFENDEYCFKRLEDLTTDTHLLSDIVSDNTISIKLNELSFEESLPEEHFNKLSDWGINYGEESNLEEGQVYARLTYELTNNSKTNIQIGDYYNRLRIYIDYNDGFLFSTDDSNYSYCFDGENPAGYNGVGLGDDIIVQPLQTKNITTYLRCSEKLLTDEKSSLN